MKSEDDLQEVIDDVERIEHRLEERVEEMKVELDAQHHLPGDEGLARVFPIDPPHGGTRAPELGS
jgi:hypothetical protein